MGLLGIAMSRYSGCWVGMKVISDTVETTAAIDLDGRARASSSSRPISRCRRTASTCAGRTTAGRRTTACRNYKGYAAIAFARANGVDRTVFDCRAPASWHRRLGQGLRGRAPGAARARDRRRGRDPDRPPASTRCGMPWPLEPESCATSAKGWRRCWSSRSGARSSRTRSSSICSTGVPTCGRGSSASSTIRTARCCRSIASSPSGWWPRRWPSASGGSMSEPAIAARIAGKLAYFKRARQRSSRHTSRRSAALPYFCSGCPHNTSTRVPEGSRALAGIGCHFMAQWMDRRTETFTHMGGEGVPWVGSAPFTDETPRLRQSRRRHLLPFRHPGDPPGGRLGRQHHLQGAVQRRRRDDRRPAGRRRAERAADQPPAEAGGRRQGLPPVRRPGALPRRRRRPRHRDPPPRRDRRACMAELRETPGCTAIIYDQTCAAEKRRRRKRGTDGGPRARGSSSTTWSARAAATARCSATASRSSRWRPRSAASGDQPVDLQQGLLLPQGLLPVVRHRRRRQACASRLPAGGELDLAASAGAGRADRSRRAPTTSRSPASAAPAC